MTKLDICIKYLRLILAESGHGTYGAQLEEDLARLKARPPKPRLPEIVFDNVKAQWLIPLPYLEVWRRAYPAVNIQRELEAAAAWLMANPKKAPRSTYSRFLTGWLSRTQDKGGTRGFVQPNQTDKAEAWAKLNP